MALLTEWNSQVMTTHAVNKETLQATITEKLLTNTPSSGDNLLGFDFDLFLALDRSPYFCSVRTYRDDSLQNMIQATCKVKKRYRRNVNALPIIASLWAKRIAYEYFQQYSFRREGKQLLFSFVTSTGASEHDLCVAGTIRIFHAFPQQRYH